jgi:hypothetical protein
LRLDVPWGRKIVHNVDTTFFEPSQMRVVHVKSHNKSITHGIDTTEVMVIKIDTIADTIKPLVVAPSVGFDLFVRESESGAYKTGIIPGVGYGLKFKPTWWHGSKYFLSLDLFVQGLLTDEVDAHAGNDFFNIDFIPVLVLIDWFGFGFGPRFKIGLENVPSEQRWIFSFGIRKST